MLKELELGKTVTAFPQETLVLIISCLSECKYCYANRKPEIPKNVIKLHDEKSPLLLGHLKENDNLIDTEVIRYIEPKQSTLFDF